MKFLDRFSALLFNLCILLLSVLVPVLVVASTPSFYQARFQETGVYSSIQGDTTYYKVVRYVDGDSNKWATFTDEQYNEIIDHFVDYFFGDKESFALTMDNVNLNGKLTDGVEIFGDVAVSHMQDVKDLFHLLMVVSAIAAALAIACVVYFCRRPKSFLSILWKYSIGFYLVFISAILLFCVVTFFTIPDYVQGWEETLEFFPTQLWQNMHHIFFLFSPEDVNGSFFNDALTMILSLDFFMTTVFIILTIMAIIVIAWLVIAYLLKRKAKQTA